MSEWVGDNSVLMELIAFTEMCLLRGRPATSASDFLQTWAPILLRSKHSIPKGLFVTYSTHKTLYIDITLDIDTPFSLHFYFHFYFIYLL